MLKFCSILVKKPINIS